MKCVLVNELNGPLVVLLQHLIIFIDSEGSPILELSAIAMNFHTREIVDVFHEYASEKQENNFARLHVHGLDQNYVKEKGYGSSKELIHTFLSWLKGKIVLTMFGNNPAFECKELDLNILDIDLDKWIDRIDKPYHIIANAFKNKFIPILGRRCSPEAHSSFRGVITKTNKKSDIARQKHGVHCSLYDCYEMYLCYISTL